MVLSLLQNRPGAIASCYLMLRARGWDGQASKVRTLRRYRQRNL